MCLWLWLLLRCSESFLLLFPPTLSWLTAPLTYQGFHSEGENQSECLALFTESLHPLVSIRSEQTFKCSIKRNQTSYLLSFFWFSNLSWLSLYLQLLFSWISARVFSQTLSLPCSFFSVHNCPKCLNKWLDPMTIIIILFYLFKTPIYAAKEVKPIYLF